MVPFLNLLKVHTACLGNHDFDFGIDELEYTVGSCNFPWLLTNVFERSSADSQRQMDRYLYESAQCPAQREPHDDKRPCSPLSFDEENEDKRPGGLNDEPYVGLPGEPLANAWKYRLFEWQGVRIGVIGLVERGKQQCSIAKIGRMQSVETRFVWNYKRSLGFLLPFRRARLIMFSRTVLFTYFQNGWIPWHASARTT